MTFQKTALILFLVFLLSSCSSPASQCKQFADVTQHYQPLREEFEANIKSAQVKASGAKNLKDVQAAATDYSAAVNAAAGKLNDMIQDLGGLNVTDPQLNEYRENYVTALTGSKVALGTASEAMQLVVNAKTEDALRDVFNTYQTKGNRAYDDILLLDAKESAIVKQVNDYCAQSFK